MEKAVLIEQTARKIKLAELIVLVCLFGSIATGLGTDRAGMLVRKHRHRIGADVSLASARNRYVLHRRSCLPRILRCSRLAVVGERVSQMLDFHF